MNVIFTIITMALLIFQVRSNRARFRIGSNAVSHVAQSKSYVPSPHLILSERPRKRERESDDNRDEDEKKIDRHLCPS